MRDAEPVRSPVQQLRGHEFHRIDGKRIGERTHVDRYAAGLETPERGERRVETAEVRETLLKQGLRPSVSSPEEFAEQVRSDLARWAKVVADGKITAD